MMLTGLLYEALELGRRALDLLTAPGPVYLLIRKVGDDMATEYQVTGVLPPVNPGDKVTTREVVFTVNGTAQPSVSLPATANQFDQWAKEGDKVKMTLVDIDQAGNRSTARESTETTVSDTVPPHQPGEVQLKITDQREVDDNPTPPTPPSAAPKPKKK